MLFFYSVANFLSVFCQHQTYESFLHLIQTVHNEILKSRLVEESSGKNHKGVEPATSLIQSLSNKLSREVSFYISLSHHNVTKYFLVLEGIVLLSVRH